MTHLESAAELARYLELEPVGEIALVRLKDDFLEATLDLSTAGRFWDLLEGLSADPAIHALLIVASSDCFSPERDLRFWQAVASAQTARSGGWTQAEVLRVAREHNAMYRFITIARSCPKPVVAALRGRVTCPFLGVTLACDARIIADDTVFHNRCQEINLPPGGGLTYFLPLYVGWGRAVRMLTECADLTADEALASDLVNRVVPAGQLESAALAYVRDLLRRPRESLRTIKALLNLHLAGMHAHLDQERTEFEHGLDFEHLLQLAGQTPPTAAEGRGGPSG